MLWALIWGNLVPGRASEGIKRLVPVLVKAKGGILDGVKQAIVEDIWDICKYWAHSLSSGCGHLACKHLAPASM